jgi:hypothetical protein
MEVFGIMGMSLGTIGFVFAIICFSKMQKLIATLKEKGILEDHEDKQ